MAARVSAAKSEVRRSEGEERGRRFRRGMRDRSSLMFDVVDNTIVDRVHESTVVRSQRSCEESSCRGVVEIWRAARSG